MVGVMALVALAAWWKDEINWYFLIPIVGLIMLPSLMLAAFMTQTLSREAAESIRPHRFEFFDTYIRVIPVKEKPSELTASDSVSDSVVKEGRDTVPIKGNDAIETDDRLPDDCRQENIFPDTRCTYDIPMSDVTDIELTGECLMVKLRGPLSRFILVPHQSLSRDESRRLIAFMRALTAKPDAEDADW